MKKLWCAVALAAATLTMPAHAQSKKELVQKILAQQQPGIEALARDIARDTAGRVMRAAAAGLQSVPSDKREAAGKAIEADIKKFYDETDALLRDRAVKLSPATIGATLEEKFTEDELKQLLAWFESPVNKKYQQLGPEMQNGLAQKLVADTKPAIEPKLKALEQSIKKQLGTPLAADSAPPAAVPKLAPAPKNKN
jgi:hypothetical protein